MKKCTGCKEDKLLSEFSKRGKSATTSQCKSCLRQRQAESVAKIVPKYDELGQRQCKKCKVFRPTADYNRYKSVVDGLNLICRVCTTAYAKGYDQAKRENGLVKFDWLKRAYKLSEKDYYSLLNKQNNKCAVCQTAVDQCKRLVIDHNHKCCPETPTCGKCVRGVLCQNCNLYVGHYENALPLLNNIQSYLGE